MRPQTPIEHPLPSATVPMPVRTPTLAIVGPTHGTPGDEAVRTSVKGARAEDTAAAVVPPRLLSGLLAFGTLVSIALGLTETRHGMATLFNLFCYVLITGGLTFGAVLAWYRPERLPLAGIVVTTTLAGGVAMGTAWHLTHSDLAPVYVLAARLPWTPIAYVMLFLTAGVRTATIGVPLTFVLLNTAALAPLLAMHRPMTPEVTLTVVNFVLAQLVVVSLLIAFRRLRRSHDDSRVQMRAMALAAETDALTGLRNRRSGQQALERLMREAPDTGRSHAAARLGVILLDVDHFKHINDEHGHPIGDAVLGAMAALLRQHARPSDLTCRWGGEEFLILAPGCSLEQARGYAERLRTAMAANPWPTRGTVTASFGVTVQSPRDSAGALVDRADEALYHAKRAGRNRVVTQPAPPREP